MCRHAGQGWCVWVAIMGRMLPYAALVLRKRRGLVAGGGSSRPTSYSFATAMERPPGSAQLSIDRWPPLSVQMTAPLGMLMSGT